MSPSRQASFVLLSVLCLGSLSCRRQARPDGEGERAAHAGVEVLFGDSQGPELTWDFGDGTPRVSAKQPGHIFRQKGRYLVRGFHRGEQVIQLALLVRPRPVLAAIPPTSTSAIYLEQLQGNFEPVVDCLERLLGAERVQQLIEDAVVASLAMDWSGGGEGLVDPEEGLALFTLPDFEGLVAALGVLNGERALAKFTAAMEAQGGKVSLTPDASLEVLRTDGRVLGAMVDRGYLYVAIPNPSGDDESELWVDPSQKEPSWDPRRAFGRIRQASQDGLSGQARHQQARGQVAPGSMYLYASGPRHVPERASPTVQAVLMSLAVADGEVTLDGVVHAAGPLWRSSPGALPLLGPEGPVAAARLTVPPLELMPLGLGRLTRTLRSSGIKPEPLFAAMNGDLTVLAYFDAHNFYDNLLAGTERAEPRGAMLIDAGLKPGVAGEPLFLETLGSVGLRWERVDGRGQRRYRSQVLGHPIEVSLPPGRLRVTVGTGVEGREAVDLQRILTERFGAGAFEGNHLSFMADIAQLRRDVESPRQLEGVDPRRMLHLQAFTSQYLRQLTPIEQLYLDLAPDAAGARARGRLVLRSRSNPRTSVQRP